MMVARFEVGYQAGKQRQALKMNQCCPVRVVDRFTTKYIQYCVYIHEVPIWRRGKRVLLAGC